MDGRNENKSINLQKEFITAKNIVSLFQKYKVPENFSLLSIDIDGNDFYIWYKLAQANYKPEIVIIEYNHTLGLDNVVMKYNKDYVWNKRSNLGGASITAYYNLGNMIEYTLIYTNRVNLYFIRNDIIQKINNNNIFFKNQGNPTELFKNCIPNKDFDWFYYKIIKYRADYQYSRKSYGIYKEKYLWIKPTNKQYYISSEEAISIAEKI